MKRYTQTCLVVSLLFSLPLLSQSEIFYPKVYDYPDLSEEGIAKRAHIEAVVDSMNLGLITPEERKPEENQWYDEYEEIHANPYSTAPIGCSWYCAAEPDRFSSNSTLASKTDAYHVKHLHDWDLRTAWVEGQEDDGEGAKATIQFDFKRSPQLKMHTIYINNGYCKSEDLWKKNGRAKELILYVNGERVGILKLEDTYRTQTFEVGEHAADENGILSVTFEIESTYPGSKYTDTAISEINFDGSGDH